jgi:membrane protein implicated in regulation of membrane protease activity
MSGQTILLILLGMGAIALGIVGLFIKMPFVSAFAVWIIVGGAALLLIAALFRDRREEKTHTERVIVTRP